MRRLCLASGLAFLVVFSLGPFVWSFLTSLKGGRELFSIPPTYFPQSPSLEHYTGVFEQRPFARYIGNSLIVGAGSTLIALGAASLAAYALARLRIRFSGAFEKALLLLALVPPALLVIPLHDAARLTGLSNSRLALILIHAALNLPFAVWMLTAFFRGIPGELLEAARLDGLSRVQILRRIVLPLAAPGLAATAILVFIFSWNEFALALTLLTRDDVRTVPVGIAMLSGVTVYEVPWGQISAAVVMTTLPVVAAVILFQRWIVGGLTAGALKG
ncbi:MAG: carbohydrate ABC transporter permease [Planctomycetes bacterium]|nr:carbohydrate ABC transporter permease [Planctomycetota bacterium]